MLLRIEHYCYSLILSIAVISMFGSIFRPDYNLTIFLFCYYCLLSRSMQRSSLTSSQYIVFSANKQIFGLTVLTFIADILWIVYQTKTLPKGHDSISRTFIYSTISLVLGMILKVESSVNADCSRRHGGPLEDKDSYLIVYNNSEFQIMSCSDNESSDSASATSEHPQQAVPQKPRVSMLTFMQKIYKKFRVLKKLTESEREQFELEVIKLLVSEDESLDPDNYELLVGKPGLEAFVLEILAETIQRQQPTKTSKLEKDLKDINDIIEEKQSYLAKREKILQDRQIKICAKENQLWQTLKTKTQKHQKDVMELIAKKEQQITKKINASMRSLKIKQEIVKQKIQQLAVIQDKASKFQVTQKKFKERIKLFEKRQEQLKKKQSNQYKQQTQVNDLKSQTEKIKNKNQELSKKLVLLNHTLTEKTKIILSRDAQIVRLKQSVKSMNDQMIEIENIKLNKKVDSKSPKKILNQQLNISDIIHEHKEVKKIDLLRLSQLSQDEQEQIENTNSKQEVSLEKEYILIIEALLKMKNCSEIRFSLEIKKAFFQIMCRNMYRQCQSIKKQCLMWIYQSPNQYCHMINKLPAPTEQSLYTSLLFLFSTQISNSIVSYLDSLSLYSDENKLQLVEQKHLQKIISNIGLKNVFDQTLSGSIVELMLRSIEHGDCYEAIIQQLCRQPYTNYLQTLFQKYDMQDDIIQNISVLLSRISLFKKVTLRPSFLKSLKIKIKTIGDGLTKMNLKSILSEVEK